MAIAWDVLNSPETPFELAGGELEHGGVCEGGSVRCGAQALTVAGLDEEGGARGR